MQCPRDQSELSPHQKGQLNIHLCDQCRGFSILLNQDSASQLEVLLKKHLSDRKDPSGEKSLPSPHSGSSMKEFVYRGVQLDYCEESHSIWFDRGEYTKIFTTPNKTKKTSNNKKSSESSVWDNVDFLPDVSDVVDLSADALGTVGDFVGDLVSGIDLF